MTGSQIAVWLTDQCRLSFLKASTLTLWNSTSWEYSWGDCYHHVIEWPPWPTMWSRVTTMATYVICKSPFHYYGEYKSQGPLHCTSTVEYLGNTGYRFICHTGWSEAYACIIFLFIRNLITEPAQAAYNIEPSLGQTGESSWSSCLLNLPRLSVVCPS